MLKMLTMMPFRDVDGFIRALSDHGVSEPLARSCIDDPVRAARMADAMIAEYQRNPGKRFIVDVNWSHTRLQLIRALTEAGVNILEAVTLTAIEPISNPQAPEPQPASWPVERLETFLVPLCQHKRTSRREAAEILTSLGVESVIPKVALACAIQKPWWGLFHDEHRVVTMNAWLPGDKPSFLEFVHIGACRKIALHEHEYFEPGTLVLAQRKAPQPQKDAA